jgi:hypothetical protein
MPANGTDGVTADNNHKDRIHRISFHFLPNEFMAPANQVVQEETSPDINEDEQLGGLMAQLVLAKQATFDKPARNRHMRPLYL